MSLSRRKSEFESRSNVGFFIENSTVTLLPDKVAVGGFLGVFQFPHVRHEHHSVRSDLFHNHSIDSILRSPASDARRGWSRDE